MIAVIVQGLFEKSDSIGFDAIYQFRLFRELYGASRPVRIFADTFNQELYPDVRIERIDVLLGLAEQQRDLLIVYHFCDGWPLMDDMLARWAGAAAVRWHNNTPPWFFATTSRRSADRSARGFDKIMKLARNERLVFWVNSVFTARQLEVLTSTPQRCRVIYPASRYIDAPRPPTERPRPFPAPGTPIRLLFVGRIVAHKGHKHVIALASLLQRYCNREVIVDFAGREDSSAWKFNTFLRELAEISHVAVNFLGEVTESALRLLYERATVFVCLSEHEGFGLPPFEAMRCGLPIVAWANTALCELLRDHPLCSETFDLRAFAAAIVALEDDELRAKVIALQSAIVETYTPAVLRRSLEAAIEAEAIGAEATGAEDWKAEAIDATAVTHPALSVADLLPLREATRSLRDFPYRPPCALDRDISNNFVTAYDVAAYTALLGGGTQQALAALGDAEVAPVAVAEVRIEVSEFSTHHGTFRDGGLHFQGPYPSSDKFVFGPYVKLPTGSFEVSFEIDEFRDLDPDGLLHLDVYVDGKGIVARRSVFATILRGSTVELDFRNESSSDVVEFRIGPGKGFAGSFRFAGARIRRVAPREMLASGPPRTAAAKLPERFGGGDRPRPGLLQRLAGGQLFAKSPSGPGDDGAAATLFDMGDRARDVGSWSEAAEFYRRGLEIRPNVVRYIIQMAHAFKESGQLAAAEVAYLGALDLYPDDRDLKLQLGHFYNVSGRRPLAEHYYMEAVRGDGATLDAYEELLRLGTSADAIHATARDG